MPKVSLVVKSTKFKAPFFAINGGNVSVEIEKGECKTIRFKHPILIQEIKLGVDTKIEEAKAPIKKEKRYKIKIE